MSEEEMQMEFTSDYEAIEAASTAYRLATEIDPMLLSDTQQRQLRRIKKNALFIIDEALKYMREPYEKEEKDTEEE